jgi:hypothetical protein
MIGRRMIGAVRCDRMAWLLFSVLVGVIAFSRLGPLATHERTTMAAEPATGGTALAHNVYFSLKDRSAAKQQELIDGCRTYLTNHPGVIFCAFGHLSDLKRDVNDRTFDIGLHVVFENRAAHDRYQTAPRHNEFVAKFKSNWAKVRVFDTDVEVPTHSG